MNNKGVWYNNDLCDKKGIYTIEQESCKDDNLATAAAKVLIQLKQDKII